MSITKPTHPKELVDYQTGAVVSKTLVKQPTGTVTLFAFDQGQNLSEHTAPFDALVQVLDGEALITIGGVEHRVKNGEMITLPAGIPHAVAAPVPFTMLLTMIKVP
ncbi:MAG: cupin domain-containing protein [FCB group bacterium]|nr:cupin domain-containing protein [FCB group bacterium]